MTPPVAFRPAQRADVGVVHRLRREFYAEDGSAWNEHEALAALERLVDQPAHGRVWLAIDAERVVGYAVLTFSYSLEFHGRDAFVDELYVRPTHRGRGLGADALNLLETACREEDVRALHLEVSDANLPAQTLYRRQGFTEHGRRLMTKWLSGDGS
jgi:ribosomal protein S18 acetylase RimI-like enzyme